MINARNLPEKIQWYEGMLLAPQHFQQSSLRHELLLHYHLNTISPFHWGVRYLKIDQALLIDGTLRVLELDATMPDGLVVSCPHEEGNDLEVDLTPFAEEMKQSPLTVHLAVPAQMAGETITQGRLERYHSVEGKAVADENTGESEFSMPRHRPRLRLLATETPPQKYVAFPIAKVIYEDEIFSLTDFIAPSLTISIRSEIGEICSQISHRLREKAMFLSERVRTPSSIMKGAMLLETKMIIQGLVSALPHFEAVLSTGTAHPFALYLSLCSIVGQVATIGKALLPPVLSPYNHNDPHTSFEQARAFIFQMMDEGILESHTGIPFDFETGKFGLKLEESWISRTLIIGVRERSGMTEKDVLKWVEESLIGSGTKIESLKEKRILGAERRRIEGDEELMPVSGVVLFAVKAEPEFIQPNEDMQIYNTSDPNGKRSPAEIVLYVKNK